MAPVLCGLLQLGASVGGMLACCTLQHGNKCESIIVSIVKSYITNMTVQSLIMSMRHVTGMLPSA